MDIPTERFKQYEETYLKTIYAFEVAKNEFEKKYVAPICSTSNYKWNLIYKDNTVKIQEIK